MAGPEYAKKKNAELEELLKARGLPHTGKKAELVARLQEVDAAKAGGAAAPAAAGEDEIDWDDAGEAQAAATTKPAADAIAAGGEGRVANPLAVPNQVQGEDPAKDDLAVKQPEPVKDYAAGLASSSLTDELEKRKARAARFGLADESAAVDKELARAKRFGTDAADDAAGATSAVGALDAALPDEQRKKRGRGPEVHGRDGKRRDSRRRDQRGGDRVREGGVKKAGAPVGDADRLKAEARAKRFAAAT